MRLGKEFVGTMKDDAFNLIAAVENYFAINKEAIFKKIMTENFNLEEANSIFQMAKQDAIKVVLGKYLKLYKSRQNGMI